ncbi:MAG: DNA repair protein RecN [Oscillospiraceae bacterium]|nr:DNA repair protein RecN [Oscillospiraceae bacterium]
MLSLLHIENVAVVEKAEIAFGPGFNVLTGETGAGKSIVIDAIGAVLGGRVSRELVRTGAEYASITAVFADIPQLPWFEENGVDWEDELFLQRKITAEGKGSCRVNGAPISAGQLKALGEQLLNIHGQHEGTLLLEERYHLSYLDGFGSLDTLLTTYRTAYDEHRTIQKEYDTLQMDESEKARRIDTLEHQIEELETANLRPGEEEELREHRSLLANAGKLAEAVEGALVALYGDEDGSAGAIDLLGRADDQISYAASLSERFKPVAGDLSDARYRLEDTLEQLKDLRESLAFSPQELDELESRLALLRRLTRKYGGGETEMHLFLARCKEELDGLSYSANRAAKLEKQLAQTAKAVQDAGETLRSARQTAAADMEARIITELKDLSMPGVRFAVEFEAQAPDRTGVDFVSFVMSANAGEKLGKLSKIASGGELARIMLALKRVLAESETVSTMVFDEVDTGVSGIAAQRVGEKMSGLAGQKQVICVTHLPQIAALADGHYLISKSVSGERTYTQVGPLDHEGRKLELARLTGGENITEVSLLAANEQLEAAEQFKKSRKVK